MSKALALASASHMTIGASTPSLRVPHAANDNYVSLSIAYDAFNMEDLDHHEVEWRDGLTLSEALGELPPEAEWGVFLNGKEIEPETHGDTKLSKLDHIGLVLIPQGGGGSLKKIVMAVAAVAMIVVGATVPGMQFLLPVGISMLVGLASMMLMMPKQKSNQDDPSTYGIDGAKNSATEGIVYPVVYGQFRCAGNFSDCYTVNVGDTQYLYLRTVLNDGEIFDATDIEINEQPLSNFKDVQWRLNKGTLTDAVNDWFPSSIVQVNQAAKLTTDFTTYTTSGPVDKVRFDVAFTEGLADINTKTGAKGPFKVELECQYRKHGDTAWSPMPIANTHGGIVGTSGNTGTSVSTPGGLQTTVAAPLNTSPTVIATNTSTLDQHILGTMSPTTEEMQGYSLEPSGSISAGTDVTPMYTRVLSLDTLPAGDYTIDTGAGRLIDYSVGGTSAAATPATVDTSGGTGRVTFSDSRTVVIRKSIESGQLPEHAVYDVQIRRTVAEDTAQDHLDTVQLTDIAEITNIPVALRGTANLSLRIKLTDQLNQIPQVTCIVKSMSRRYDVDGNVIDIVPTSNAAWHGLDILLSPERGVGYNPNRIDWPRWVEFAQWCDDNAIQFNGVFTEASNAGDALRQVLRIGQAIPVPFGTKISVAIDRPRDPVHVFTTASILQDTFQVTYLSLQDRANEYEVTYYDKTDRNKAKTIRYVDPNAVLFNEQSRTAQLSFIGIDNIDQARLELWKAIYQNRLIIRTVQFDSWLDSINMTLGETTLIQHDLMDWANSGRLAAGSTNLILNLDQSVTLDGASNTLVHFDALLRATTTVYLVAGKTVMVNKPGGADFDTLTLNSKRLIIGTDDYEIASITNGATYHTIVLTTAPTANPGDTVELWDTDVVIETPVTSVAQNADGTSSVTLTTPLPQAPDQYANFAFGPVTSVKKPYVLTGIQGNGIEKRTLLFTEYNEDVYGPAEVELPVPVQIVSDREVAQVRGLAFSFDSIVTADAHTLPVTLNWRAGHIVNYAGADIFVGINGEGFQSAGSAMNTTTFQVQVKPGDTVAFMVIPFNKRGDRAPITTAPMISGTVAVTYADLDPPTAVTVTDVHFEVDGKVAVGWTNPVDMTGVKNFEVQYKRAIDSAWTSVSFASEGPVEIPGLPTGNYSARVRSSNVNSTSVWVEQDFVVAVAPGSLMDNWNSRNDRNGDPIPAPTLPATGSVDHTENTDGSANISFEWLWGGDEATIDGFEVTIDGTPPA